MNQFKKIHPHDNVLIVCKPLRQDNIIIIEGQEIRLHHSFILGQKMAARFIKTGEKVMKFGLPIGSATKDIHPGEHVHLHNMKSDFIPTYTLDNAFTKNQ